MESKPTRKRIRIRNGRHPVARPKRARRLPRLAHPLDVAREQYRGDGRRVGPALAADVVLERGHAGRAVVDARPGAGQRELEPEHELQPAERGAGGHPARRAAAGRRDRGRGGDGRGRCVRVWLACLLAGRLELTGLVSRFMLHA